MTNRQTWTVTGIGDDGSLVLSGRGRDREIPAEYARRFVELAYATTVHGAQGSTVSSAHVAIGDHTGAAAAYVAMTRGREANTAHLVAENLEDAREQWIEVFSRDRADLGPAHARRQADRRHRPLRPPAGRPTNGLTSNALAGSRRQPRHLRMPTGGVCRGWMAARRCRSPRRSGR